MTPNNPLNKTQTQIHNRLQTDLRYFCQKNLTIKLKEGGEAPLIWNRAQEYLHERIEDQLRRIGMVRLFIIKGRQQGISTYIAARLYHKATRQKAKNVFILSHHASTTETLFQIVDRYHDNCPPEATPKSVINNNRRMKFENGSQYTVGTAGSGSVGRGDTNQYFHGCVEENSLVVLADGSTKKIKDVKNTDSVRTSSGAIAKVDLVSYTGKKCVWEVQTWLTNESIKVSEDHKILTLDGWKVLSELSESDYIRLPDIPLSESLTHFEAYVPNGTRYQNNGKKHIEHASIPLDYEFGFYLGYYLAEGHVKKQNTGSKHSCVVFCFQEDETFVDEALFFAKQYAISTFEKYKPLQHKRVMTCYGTFLAEITNQICGRTKDKNIPLWFFDAPKIFLEGVVKGYLSGDGSKTEIGRTRAPSIHERVSRQLKRLILGLTSGVPGLHYYERERYGVKSKPVTVISLNGRAYNDLNDISYGQLRNERFKIYRGHKYVKVRSITPKESSNTYDLAIDHPDHDFETPIGIISNSEVAFYENTDEINTGVMQSVADIDGTEKFLESTANGIGNYFHQGCMDALSKKGVYEIVFIPWYWQPEYRARITLDTGETYDLTPQEQDLKEWYQLDDEQIQWRRNKLQELKSERKFKQEYPFTVEEAFQASGNSFIDAEKVARARKSTIKDTLAPLVLGVDPARQGDRTVITWRRGREWIKSDIYHEMDEMRLAGIIALAIDRNNVAKVFIDVALGYGTIDRLHERGYSKIVQGVHFSQKPTENIYLNKRAEMAFRLRDWIHDEGVSIPDDEEIGVDLGCIPDFKETSKSLLQLESKDTIKKDFGKSPDIFDSAILTFAEYVHIDAASKRVPKHTKNTRGGSSLIANRQRNKVKNDDWEDEFDKPSKTGWSKK